MSRVLRTQPAEQEGVAPETLTRAAPARAGYHNMCRWNFRGMLEHPRIRRLDYYCRMDTDSRIKKKVRV